MSESCRLKFYVRAKNRTPLLGVMLEDLASLVQRLATGTVARGATVAGRRRQGGTRPATGSHNPQAVDYPTQIPTENLAAPPL
ncbi:hypothetical protein ACLOJK_006654 [Asimina triloba]